MGPTLSVRARRRRASRSASLSGARVVSARFVSARFVSAGAATSRVFLLAEHHLALASPQKPADVFMVTQPYHEGEDKNRGRALEPCVALREEEGENWREGEGRQGRERGIAREDGDEQPGAGQRRA